MSDEHTINLASPYSEKWAEVLNRPDELAIQLCDILGIDWANKFVQGITLRAKAGRVPSVTVDFLLTDDEWESTKAVLSKYRAEVKPK